MSKSGVGGQEADNTEQTFQRGMVRGCELTVERILGRLSEIDPVVAEDCANQLGAAVPESGAPEDIAICKSALAWHLANQ